MFQTTNQMYIYIYTYHITYMSLIFCHFSHGTVAQSWLEPASDRPSPGVVEHLKVLWGKQLENHWKTIGKPWKNHRKTMGIHRKMEVCPLVNIPNISKNHGTSSFSKGKPNIKRQCSMANCEFIRGRQHESINDN